MTGKFIRIFCCVVIFAVLYSSAAHSQAPDKQALSHFYRANLLYEKTDYKEAVKEYQAILALGYENSAVYYNLANSYVKDNQLPLALLNYEKALRLAPRERDIQANYSYVCSLLQANENERQPQGLASIPFYMFKPFSLDELTLVASFLYLLLLSLISLGLIGRLGRQKLLAIGSGIFLLLMISSFALSQRISCLGKQAIALDKTLPVRFEPLDTATVYFELSAGSKAGIVECQQDWCKIERPDRKLGWVKKDGLAIF